MRFVVGGATLLLTLFAATGCTTPYVWFAGVRQANGDVLVYVEAGGGDSLLITTEGGEHIIEGKMRGDTHCLPGNGESPYQAEIIITPNVASARVHGELFDGPNCDGHRLDNKFFALSDAAAGDTAASSTASSSSGAGGGGMGGGGTGGGGVGGSAGMNGAGAAGAGT